MKKLGIIIVAVLFGLIVVAALGVKAYTSRQANGNGDDEAVKVELGDLVVKVIESGTLEATKTVEVKSRVSGRIQELFVDEGDTVEAGQLIARIDPQETNFRVEQDRARVKAATAQLVRLGLEIEQREGTVKTQLSRARSRVDQLKVELEAQPTLTQAEIDRSETTLNNARTALQLLETVSHPNQRASYESQVSEVKSNWENAKSELDRQQWLFDQGYVSARDLERANNQFELAEARQRTATEQLSRLESEQQLDLDRARETVRQAESDLQRARTNSFRDYSKQQEYERSQADLSDALTAQSDIAVLGASRMQQQANLEQVQNVLSDSLRELGETDIRSPISGVVTKRFVQEGKLVASLSSFSSGTTIMMVEDRTAMIVKLYINEIDVAKLRLGLEAKIDVEAYPDKSYTGTVIKIAPTDIGAGQQQLGDPVVKYEVEVELDTTNAAFKSGMSAKCTMIVLEKKGVLLVRRQYVGKDKDGYFVLLPKKGKKRSKEDPTRVSVEVGDSSASKFEITSGVEEGTVLEKPEFAGPPRKGMMDFGSDDEESSEPEDEE